MIKRGDTFGRVAMEIKRIKVDRDTRFEPILAAAAKSLVFVQFGDAALRLIGSTSPRRSSPSGALTHPP